MTDFTKRTVENFSDLLEAIYRDDKTELFILNEKTGEKFSLDYDYYLKKYISDDYSVEYDEDEEPIYSASFIFDEDEIYRTLEVISVTREWGGYAMTFKANA